VRLGVVLSVLSLLPAGALAAGTARVTVPSTAPVAVRGTGFKSHERVTVTVIAKAAHTRRVTATSQGTFRARFASVSLGYCQAYSVRARGNRGSTAFLKVVPECAPRGPAGVFWLRPGRTPG
jgi:hypothetical protein